MEWLQYSPTDSAYTAEALLLSPPHSENSPVPLVVRPHGGPHSMSVDAFDVQTATLLASGIAILLPNYRGSLGYGRDFAECLLGHVGKKDVEDVEALTRIAISKNIIDESRVAVYGGSHGGFLTAWLLASEKTRSLFCTGVLWNPVVDLPAMLASTDIPEWCVAEALCLSEVKWPLTPEQLQRLYAASPISCVDGVQVPTLTIIGAADQRVPPSQGREWVAALESCRLRTDGPLPGEVDALFYEGEGHAIAGSEANAHATQAAMQWLAKYLIGY